MRPLLFPDKPRPADVPIAGTTLSDLLLEFGTHQEVIEELKKSPNSESFISELQSGDTVRKFRTPPWTWTNMAGLEGWLVLRDGKAIFWVLTRMN